MGQPAEPLAGRRILVCVTGSIAAYKSVYLVRSLVKLGAFVSVAMTPSAGRFVGSETFSAMASEPAYDDLWDNRGSIAHTSLGKNSDLVIVMPATASILSKSAHGISDDIVSATLLCTPQTTKVIFVPAMHEEMYDNPSTQENIEKLKLRGHKFLGPVEGELAGGDKGRGRLVEPDQVLEAVIAELEGMQKRLRDNRDVQEVISGESTKSSQPLMVVTAGGTREPIDPVRVITNRSSGKMGHAIAEAASMNGYRVVLVTTSDLAASEGIERIQVETAQQMLDAVMKYLDQSSVVVMAAAVADVTPKEYSPNKLKRENGIESIELKPTEDIVANVIAKRRESTFVVCFGAESDYVLENARKKFQTKKVDMLIANDITRSDSGFGSDTNKLWIFNQEEDQPIELPTTSKQALGYEIVEMIDAYRQN